MTALRDEALATLTAWRGADARQERLRTSYVAHLATYDDGTDRGCTPAHVTAGVLLLSADRTRVLLTLHAKARRWFHLGGHCEAGDATLAGAARREGLEESGIPGLQVDPHPLHLDAHVVGFCGEHAQVSHLDVRFLALAPEGAEPVVGEESFDVRWWPVEALPTDEPNMRELVDLALRRAAQRYPATPGTSVPSSSAAI